MTGAVLADRFELLAVAGEGGMGTVHRARDRETGELVAVKVLSPRARAEADRFVREAELLAELRHPSIVRYVAHGVARDGQAFLAMEWLEGEDLGSRLGRGALPLDDALAVVERVGSALSVAHARGVVHRDIKPSNVFLVSGLASEARVLDFGVALIAGTPKNTRTGIVVGTPGYMAPEQARGERTIDARADVFALGCVLYECLTGAPAFFGENLLALLGRILLEDPRPPSEVCALPRDVERLVMRMLAKDPAARPRDGGAVVEALGKVPPSTMAPAPAAAALGALEQEWVSLVFARDPAHVATAQAETLASGEVDTLGRAAAALGARIERLLDGTLVARLPASGPPRDRALRAARCSLALRASLGNDTRVAVVTGRGVRGARAPVGEVIDRAAALLAYPRSPQGPRVDAGTAGLLETRFSLGGDGASLTIAGELPDDEAPRRLLGHPSPCVGRDRELATLTGLFDECVAESVARVVLVTAPPGTGKSRLRIELLARLAARGDVAPPWVARADVMSAGSPNGMLVSLVRSAAGLHDGEPLDVQRRKLSARVAQHVAPAEADRVAAFLGELVQAPYPDDGLPALRGARKDAVALGDQIAAAWDDFLRAELESGPRVLVLEDLHWGDLPTVRACDRALRRFKDAPLFVVATARPEVHESFPALWEGRDVQEIRLVPLSARASERLVKAALGAKATPEVLARLVSRSEGNPFLLEELARATADGASDALPDTVLAMTAARLSALDDASRRFLRAASVFGEVFWRGGVSALTGDPDVNATIARIEAAEIVEPRRASRFDGERELSFRHALLRDAAYAALTPEDRAVGHRLAAEWLEKAGERDDLALAEHRERGGDAALAATHYARAAERALEGNDFAAVVRHATRALAAGEGGTFAAACHRLIADAEQWRGRYEEALAAAVEATSLFAPGSIGWYRSVMLQAVSVQRLGRGTELIPLARLAMAQAPEPDAGGRRIEVLIRLAMRLQFFEQRGPAADLLDLAESAPVPPDDPAALGWLAAAKAIRAHIRGDLPVYLEHIDRAATLLREAGNVRDAISQMEDQGWWWQHCGQFDRAEVVTLHVIEEAERLGLRRVETNARMALALHRLSSGRPAEARAGAGRVADDPAATPWDKTNARLFVAWALLDEKRYGEAMAPLTLLHEALPVGGGYWRVMTGFRAETLLALGRIEEASAVARELGAVLDEGVAAPHFDVEALCSLAKVRTALGDLPGARDAVAKARAISEKMVAGFSDPAAREHALTCVSYHAKARALARELGVG